MTVKKLAALLFSGWLASPLLWARSNSAVEAFNQGVGHFNAQEFSSAVAYFDQAISEDPNFTEALYARGACKYYMKSFHGAMMDLSRVLRARPNDLGARSMRGAIHYETERWDEALEDFNFVLARQANDPQSLLGRAVIRLKREEVDLAARDFRKFLRVRPNDPLAPEIRKILDTIGPGEPETADAPAKPRRTLTRAEINELTAKLMESPISENYQNKAIRAEKAQAVGHIESVPTVPSGPSGSGERHAPNSYGIVDPGGR